MIATISPGLSSAENTADTLRYAIQNLNCIREEDDCIFHSMQYQFEQGIVCLLNVYICTSNKLLATCLSVIIGLFEMHEITKAVQLILGPLINYVVQNDESQISNVFLYETQLLIETILKMEEMCKEIVR